MKAKSSLGQFAMLLLLFLATLACNLSANPAEPVQAPAPTQIDRSPPLPTATVPPTESVPTVSPPNVENTDAPPARPPLPHSVTSSTPDGGTCGPDYPYDCNVIVSDDSLIHFILLRDGQELGPDEGVLEVNFRITNLDRSRTIYNKVEKNPAYCIFGGSEPCNPWVIEDGVYKWGQGGEPVEEGKYIVIIDPQLDPAFDSENQVHWEAYLEISLP